MRLGHYERVVIVLAVILTAILSVTVLVMLTAQRNEELNKLICKNDTQSELCS